MAGAEHGGEDATEAPTQKRLDHAREVGNLPLSREAPMVASLAGAAFGLLVLAPDRATRLGHQMASLLGAAHAIQATAALRDGQVAGLLLSALALIGVVALPAALLTVASVLLQSNFYIAGAPIKFEFSRISPAAGFARLLSTQQLLEFLKSCAKLAALAAIVWNVLGRDPFGALGAVQADAAGLFARVDSQIVGLLKPLLLLLLALAAGDVLLARFRHAGALRMTREEVRQEHKETNGDPFIKAKLRALRQQRSRRRMMAQVRHAAVVITNPTHYAVALTYDRSRQAAPRVVAKGADFIAARIRAEAELHRVPLVENPPLARTLFTLDLDTEIPAEHYQAVAEIIAFVWKLRARGGEAAR